jgi:hypothetical protein
MSKKPDSTIFFMEEQWSFIFKMRRKNYFDKANYTFKYYINPERTKILEVSHAKYDIKTCPIFIDEIITRYCNSDYFKTFDS